jgi:hypothetical protein
LLSALVFEKNGKEKKQMASKKTEAKITIIGGGYLGGKLEILRILNHNFSPTCKNF